MMTRAKQSNKQQSSNVNAPAPYEPTPGELIAIKRLADRRANQGSQPRLKIEKTGDRAVNISIDHQDPTTGWLVLTGALGVGSARLTELIVDQVCVLSQNQGEVPEKEANQLLAIVQGIQPRDTVEALLATQMAAVHMATINMAKQLKRSENIQQQDSNSNAMNKLARTFTSQVEALKRYRTGGVQKVIVQHVQVNEGGQAIVAGEMTGGGGIHEKDNQPHERDSMCIPEGQAMLGTLEAFGVPMQGAGGDRMHGVPVSRSAGRATLRAVE